MASEWKTEHLSNLCERVVDCPHSTPVWTECGVVVIRNQNIKGGRLDLSSPSYTDEAHYEQRSRRARLRGGDLIITREAPMGEVCMVPEGLRCCLGQRMVMLRPDGTKCDPQFLLYSLQSPKVQHEIKVNDGTGSTVSNLRIPLLKALPISHPPLPEQQRIAHILGTLDDKIELNRRMNQTLEAMARALFKSWFVDFDPVRAKQQGQTPAGLDPATAELFPAEFEDSELGEIPKGWEAVGLGHVVEILDSKRVPLSKRQREERRGSYPYHGAADVMDYVDDYLFDGIHVLMGEDGSVVNSDGTPVLQYVWGKFWVNNHAHVLLGRNGVSTEHIFLHLKGAFIKPFVTGAVQPKLNQGNMKRIPFVLPKPEICKSFHKLTAPLFACIRSNREQSRTLATLRDALLPRLLSGEIELPALVALTDEVNA